MKAYKECDGDYIVTELTDNEIKKINEKLKQQNVEPLEEWGGTGWSLVYDKSRNMIELWDHNLYDSDLIKPETVELKEENDYCD